MSGEDASPTIRAEFDHFARLGLPRAFAIDRRELERRYLALSREVHPDAHQLAPLSAQRQSLATSAALNDAYATLKDPLRRADYLITLRGGPTASEQKEMPADFLEEVLEIRMEIEEAKESGGDAPAFGALRERLERDRASTMARVGETLDRGPNDADALRAARAQLNTVKYLDNLLRDLAS